jgi:UDP-glucose 4-epimerase
MRVVVTGATGNIGTALLEWLDGRAEVVGVTRHVPPESTIEWHPVDIGAPAAPAALTRAFAGADAVVHLAWHIVPGHERDAQARTNLTGMRNVLDAMRLAGVPHLVHLSSAAVYSPRDGDTRATESWPRRGVAGSSYSQDKVAAEDLLDRVTGLRITRIRPPAVMQPVSSGRLVRMALGPVAPLVRIVRGRLPVLPLPSDATIQVTDAADVADLVGRAVLARAEGAFNVANEPVLTPAVVARLLGGRHVPVPRGLLRRAAGATWRLRVQPLDPSWVDLLLDVPLLDCTRARDELGWRPAHAGRLTLLATRRAAPDRV